MKKILTVIALSIVLLLPLGVNAASTGKIELPCDKSCPNEATGKCEATCKIKISGNTGSLNEFKGTIQFVGEGVTIKSVTAADGWTNLGGTSTDLSFLAAPEVSAASFEVATIVLEIEDAATNCSLKLVNPSVGTTVETEIKQTTTVKTGATLPIAVVVCGIGAAGVIYALTRKNKKMYKI